MPSLPERVTPEAVQRLIDTLIADTPSMKKADARRAMIAQIVEAIGVDHVAAFDILAPHRFEFLSDQKPAIAADVAQAILSLPLMDMATFLTAVTGCSQDDAMKNARLLADTDPHFPR